MQFSVRDRGYLLRGLGLLHHQFDEQLSGELDYQHAAETMGTATDIDRSEIRQARLTEEKHYVLSLLQQLQQEDREAPEGPSFGGN